MICIYIYVYLCSTYLILIYVCETCVGLREHRARGRICSHPDAASGSIGRLYLAFKTKAITLLLLVAHILAM